MTGVSLAKILPVFGEGDRALLQGVVEGQSRLRNSSLGHRPSTTREDARSPSPKAGRI